MQSEQLPTIKIIDYSFVTPVTHEIPSDDGTEEAMAPELFSKAFTYTDCYATDVWALGVMLYASFAGRYPFKGFEFYLPIIEYENTFKLVFPGNFSPGLQLLLRRMLDVNSQTRITIEEIIEDPWSQQNTPF